ncbi:MAG TPA: hypothetical protein VHS03_04500 [Gaiellaceae bacterium]|jgi:hypothetical protein|nr:hypothetical protein [Gaiellaceae bacterium]
MSADLSREDARAVARILFDIHQRRAARLAAENRRDRDDCADVRNDRYPRPDDRTGDDGDRIDRSDLTTNGDGGDAS